MANLTAVTHADSSVIILMERESATSSVDLFAKQLD